MYYHVSLANIVLFNLNHSVTANIKHLFFLTSNQVILFVEYRSLVIYQARLKKCQCLFFCFFFFNFSVIFQIRVPLRICIYQSLLLSVLICIVNHFNMFDVVQYECLKYAIWLYSQYYPCKHNYSNNNSFLIMILKQ